MTYGTNAARQTACGLIYGLFIGRYYLVSAQHEREIPNARGAIPFRPGMFVAPRQRIVAGLGWHNGELIWLRLHTMDRLDT